MVKQFRSDMSVEAVNSMGDDATICAAAKVSTIGALSKEDLESEAKYGLINYLMKHRHGTPFEHTAITFLITAPIFVWREFHRHRIGFSYNEESGRYKTLDPVFYIADYDRPAMKVEGWKPGRPKFDETPSEIIDEANTNLVESYVLAYDNYLKNLALGIDPGFARDCLPLATYSSCYVTCNARSLMHFLSLRTGRDEAAFRSYPLYEIEMVANQMETLFEMYWPLTYKAFNENGRVAP